MARLERFELKTYGFLVCKMTLFNHLSLFYIILYPLDIQSFIPHSSSIKFFDPILTL